MSDLHWGRGSLAFEPLGAPRLDSVRSHCFLGEVLVQTEECSIQSFSQPQRLCYKGQSSLFGWLRSSVERTNSCRVSVVFRASGIVWLSTI